MSTPARLSADELVPIVHATHDDWLELVPLLMDSARFSASSLKTRHGFPLQFGLSVTPEAADLEAIFDLVQVADATGLDLIAIQDHAYNHAFVDTWTLIAFLAAKTHQIHFMPDVADLTTPSAAHVGQSRSYAGSTH
jgi:hypothetical protein